MPNSKIPTKFLYPYLDAIRKHLPAEIANNDTEVYEILGEIEAHLMDLISDLAELGPITDEVIQKAIIQMGEPKTIALEYHKLYTEKRASDFDNQQTYIGTSSDEDMRTVIEHPPEQPDIPKNMTNNTPQNTDIGIMNQSIEQTQIHSQQSTANYEITPDNILMQPVQFKKDKIDEKEKKSSTIPKSIPNNVNPHKGLTFKRSYFGIEVLFGLIYLIIGISIVEPVKLWYTILGSLILFDSLMMAIQVARNLPNGKKISVLNLFEILSELAVIFITVYTNLFNSNSIFEAVSSTIILILMGIRIIIIILNALRSL
jgi:hypothetical protein